MRTRTHSFAAQARDVLPTLVECVADPDCINPPGSSRANHRQEQTALNAILCEQQADPDGVCHDDKRFRMTTDFENDDDPVSPLRRTRNTPSLSQSGRISRSSPPRTKPIGTTSSCAPPAVPTPSPMPHSKPRPGTRAGTTRSSPTSASSAPATRASARAPTRNSRPSHASGDCEAYLEGRF